MEHVKVVDRWEVGDPTRVPLDPKVPGQGWGDYPALLLTSVYVDDHTLLMAPHSDDNQSALIVSVSLASDYVRLFGPGEPGETPILAPKTSSNWDTTLEFLSTLEIRSTARTLDRSKRKAAHLRHHYEPNRARRNGRYRVNRARTSRGPPGNQGGPRPDAKRQCRSGQVVEPMRRGKRQASLPDDEDEDARPPRNTKGVQRRYNAKHIPGVQNSPADGISRWARSQLAAKGASAHDR